MQHGKRCEHCEALHTIMEDIERLIRTASFRLDDDLDEALYIHGNAKRAIQSWKCHQLRSVRQDQARHDILETIDSSTVPIIKTVP